MTQLAISAGAVANIPTATQDAALEARSRWADSYLAAHWDVPLTTWSTDLTYAVSALAAYDLLISRGFSPLGVDAVLKERADQAQAWLDKVAEGTVVPALLGGPEYDVYDGAIVISNPSRGWDSKDTIYGPDFWDPCEC